MQQLLANITLTKQIGNGVCDGRFGPDRQGARSPRDRR